MAHALQHACEQNQTFQQRQWQRLPNSLHSTDGGGSEGLFLRENVRPEQLIAASPVA
jgi:hypothetical protein